MRKLVALLIVFTVLMMVINVMAQKAEKAKPETPKYQYIGAKKCKMCHNKATTGMQYSLWSQRDHAKAYSTLATDHAKKVAEEVGIEGDPQKAKECLTCHVTAFNIPAEQKAATLTLEEGVSCEACHGPGSEYKSMKVMKDIHGKKVDGAAFGLVNPTKEVCVTCHNTKSPTYKEFNFEEASKKIAHPVVAIKK